MTHGPVVDITNVVVSASVNQTIDLDFIAKNFRNTEYKYSKVPQLTFFTDYPKAKTVILGSGKMVSTGAKSEAQAINAIREVIRQLGEKMAIENEPVVTIENIVVSVNFEAVISIDRLPEKIKNFVYVDRKNGQVTAIHSGGKSLKDLRSEKDFQKISTDADLGERIRGLLGRISAQNAQLAAYKMPSSNIFVALFRSGKGVLDGFKSESEVSMTVENLSSLLRGADALAFPTPQSIPSNQFCMNCGSALKSDDKFCGHCGSPIKDAIQKV